MGLRSAYPYSDGNSHFHAHPDINCPGDAYGYTHFHADGNLHADINCYLDAYGDPNAHTHRHAWALPEGVLATHAQEC
jgi:hypothetical protein